MDKRVRKPLVFGCTVAAISMTLLSACQSGKSNEGPEAMPVKQLQVPTEPTELYFLSTSKIPQHHPQNREAYGNECKRDGGTYCDEAADGRHSCGQLQLPLFSAALWLVRGYRAVSQTGASGFESICPGIYRAEQELGRREADRSSSAGQSDTSALQQVDLR